MRDYSLVGRFGVCIWCAYREGAILTAKQATCAHEWVRFVRHTDGRVAAKIYDLEN